nr:unnamed protein product [Callosobruchus analis]
MDKSSKSTEKVQNKPKRLASEEKKIPVFLRFVFGGSAGMAGMVFVQPLELLKNRMQVDKDQARAVEVVRGIVAEKGIRGLWTGLSAGLARQATYAATRLGIYTTLFEKARSADGTPPGYTLKAGIAVFSGLCGALVDGKLPPAERRNYKHVFDVLFRIYREEGLFSLWRGTVPTMGRAVVVSVAQLATYSQAKQMLQQSLQIKDGVLLHFLSSMTSGLVTAVASMPIDIMKTRIQNMKIVDGKPEYSGPLHVFRSVVKNEGVLALWKGILPYYLRLGPHTVLTFNYPKQLANEEKKIPNFMKFVFGGSAGKGQASVVEVVRGIVAEKGITGLWTGLSAGLARQATYTTTRLGMYTVLFDKAKSADGTPPGYALKAGIAMIAGLCGAFVGTPTDLALVRMTADGRLPPAERRHYKHVFDALFRIYREEGLLNLWRGAVPTMGRAVVVNAAQLATYSQAKQMLQQSLQIKDGVLLHFLSSMTSGLVTSAASLPVDMMKTSSPVHVLTYVIKNEGVLALWKGFLPYYLKIGPHTVLTFIFLEQFNQAYLKFRYGD